MKNLVALLLLLFLASASFAGNLGHQKDIRPVKSDLLEYETDATPRPVEIIKTTETVYQLYKRPAPVKGLAIGCHGATPTAAYSLPDFDFELGATSVNGDRSGLLRAAYNLYRDNENYTIIRSGITGYLGTDLVAGCYIEAQQYLDKNVALLGTIYPLIVGEAGRADLARVVLGARLYI